MPEIHIPRLGWNLRPYQNNLWRALIHDKLNVCAVHHRRAGKDEVLLNALAVKSMQRPASYAYMFPEISHARRSMWQAINPATGKRRILETFPREMLTADPNETEMRLNLVNGSTVIFFGSDQYDRLVGASLAGIVSSEHALSHPSAYAFFSPMLRENDGFFWAISTPRGRNHFHDLYHFANKSDRWFAEILSIHDTGALTDEQIEEAKAEYVGLYGHDQGMAFFKQEYEVSFNAAILGAFYGGEMATVRSEQRIDPTLEALPGKPVHRAWDIGVRDDTSIWWFQVVGTQIFILDCYSKPGESDVEVFAEMIHAKDAEMGWNADGGAVDFVPHDARQRVWGMKRGRLETMQEFGLNPRVATNLSKLDGINAVRRTLPRCVFHTRCEDVGIPALEQYRREWDDERKTYKANEVHDWTSHPADAFRYLALSWEEVREAAPDKTPPSTVGHTLDEMRAPPLPGMSRR